MEAAVSYRVSSRRRIDLFQDTRREISQMFVCRVVVSRALPLLFLVDPSRNNTTLAVVTLLSFQDGIIHPSVAPE